MIKAPLFVAAVCAVVLTGCETLMPPRPPAMDTATETVLRAMSDKLSSVQRVQFEARSQYDPAIVEHLGIEPDNRVVVTVARPNRLHADVVGIGGGGSSRAIYVDGNNLTIHDRAVNLYGIAPMQEPTLDDALDKIAKIYGFTPPLADFIVEDPFASMTREVRSGRHLGTETVRGVTCDHVAFTGDEFDWELWVAKNDRLPRKYVITVNFLEGRPKFTALWWRWNLQPSISDSLFVFVPPQGADQIDMMPVGDGKPDPSTATRLPQSHRHY